MAAAASDPTRDARRPSRRRRASLALLALGVVLTGCTLGREPQARTAPAPQLAPSAQAAATGGIPQLVQRVEPSVVTVAQDQGTGSGVVWSKDGVVVTTIGLLPEPSTSTSPLTRDYASLGTVPYT